MDGCCPDHDLVLDDKIVRVGFPRCWPRRKELELVSEYSDGGSRETLAFQRVDGRSHQCVNYKVLVETVSNTVQNSKRNA